MVDSQVVDSQVVRIEWARLEGVRPRKAGCNARLDEHGSIVRVPLARVTLGDGSQGFGHCRATQAEAQQLIGQSLEQLFDPAYGTTRAGMRFDQPLWDLAGRRTDQPVYQVAARMQGRDVSQPLRAPCYDTSLYIDDLHLADEQSAAQLIAEEARQGLAAGHRAFKIKIGRGARHMELEAGTRRDIAVIRAVREVVGKDARVMIDVNNGYNLNLAKRVLAETADCNLFWLEEAFHEDRILYRDLQEWRAAQGLPVLIADGEGDASPHLLAWAQEGIVEIIQYDIFSYGFTPWLHLGKQLDAWKVRSAPHHYGGCIGNYVSGHLAAAIDGFTFVEWDEVDTPWLDRDAYQIVEGQVTIPALPGFGLELDRNYFEREVETGGFTVK